MFRVPLNKLYELVGSCQYNEESDFCPVLVKVQDKKVIEFNGGKRFLLQVWDRNGQMVFERPLDEPVTNWNISGDTFVFQERSDSPTIYVVQVQSGVTPIVFKFNLPKEVIAGQIDRYYNATLGKIVSVEEDKTENDEKESTEQAQSGNSGDRTSQPILPSDQEHPIAPLLKGGKESQRMGADDADNKLSVYQMHKN